MQYWKKRFGEELDPADAVPAPDRWAPTCSRSSRKDHDGGGDRASAPVSIAVAMALLSGCDDGTGAAGTTVVKIDASRCFGGSDGVVPGNCRSRLDELALAEGANGCFVALRDGESTIRRVAVQWSGGQLRATGEELVEVAPGGKIRAALFIFGAGGEGMRCTSKAGPGPDDACDPAAGCVIKLIQPSTAVPEQGVTFDFSEGGRCQVAPGLIGEAEACDGMDNDCDGETDELYAAKDEPCESGEGACRREGVQVCNEAKDALVCSEAAGGGEEICDDADNDCDGRIDEGLSIEDCCDPGSAPIGCGQPAPDSVCVAGTRRCEAAPGAPKGRLGDCVDANGQAVLLPGPRPEICDGVDDDCDGNIDEDVRLADADDTQPGDQPAAVGEACRSVEGGCVAPGVVACGPDRQPFCDHPAIVRGDEICDTVDNDCDGQVDETFQGEGLGDPCMVGVGACQAAGIRACAGPAAVACNVQPGQASDVDLCGNEIDDDCDGRVDEGHDNLGMACSAGQGACRANGAFVCSQDRRGTECSARPQAPMDELCNGADDDCDGTVDEDFEVQQDPDNCGRCGRVCDLANAVAGCAAGECVIDSCLEGFRNVDLRADNGCECNPNEPDLPDPTFTDSNCDGVDGVAARAIFVSAEAGDDARGNGDPSNPYRTIARAVDVARTLANLNNFRDIYLDSGRYDVTVNNPDGQAARTGLLIPAGVSLHGGYRYDPGAPGNPADDAWSRGPKENFRTVITGAQIVLRYQGQAGAGLGRTTRLDNLVVETIDQGQVGPLPTVGVVAVDVGDHLIIRDVEIIAHAGAAGANGVNGEDGLATAGPGGPGVNGNQPASGGNGGGGGQNASCSNVTGGDGGDGGHGNQTPAEAGFESPDAAMNPRAGAGGAVSVGGNDAANGEPGDDGANGANEVPGSITGRIQEGGIYWIPGPR
ncbi:MAG: MopE-related protein [bacterium]